MTVLRIEAAGPATSVQDAGRLGAQRFGLGPAGVLDRLAQAQANALVGAGPDAAVIEIGPLPFRLTAEGGAARLALAGAARDVRVDGRTIPMLASFLIEEGRTLALGGARGAMFSILAIAGGVLAAPVLGSLSVHARAGLGSPFARPLRAGDALEVADARPGPERRLAPDTPEAGPIRVVLGPQDDAFTPDAIACFLAAVWRVSPQSDRMGYRLIGPMIEAAGGHDIVSDGTVDGHIQIPGAGAPIVLLPDRGTTGGYPKIATIITADFGRFAQTPAGGLVSFAAITVEAAQAAARSFAAQRDAVARSVTVQTVEPMLALDEANLAGAAVDALQSDLDADPARSADIL